MALTIDNVVWAKMYVWTLKRHSDPKTRKFWADVVNWVVLINPEHILSQLENAKKRVEKAKADKSDIVVILDKGMYRDEIKDICEAQWISYLNYKVPAWVFTNFETLKSRIASMNELERFISSEDFESLTKKEKFQKIKKLKKLKAIYSWVKNLKSRPKFAIIVDGVSLSNFVDEVAKLKIDNIVVSSTDFNRYWDEDSLLISNINSYESLKTAMEYILK